MRPSFLGLPVLAVLPFLTSAGASPAAAPIAAPAVDPAPLAAPVTAAPDDEPEDLAGALAAVRVDAGDPEVHAAVARFAAAEEQADLALFHARLAKASTLGDRAHKRLVQEMDEIIAAHDPNDQAAETATDAFLEKVLSLGDQARRRDLWANAVDLYLRAEGTSLHDDAQKYLDKIYGDKDAGPALLRSGLDVPAVGGKNRKSAKWIADFDEKYSDWEKAAKNKDLDVEGYKIRTNIGYEIGTQIGFALTQVNNYLRILYRHKEAGQKLRDCEINVYKSFQDFNDAEYEGKGSAGVGGFFSPMENRIATYDQRTVGRSMDDLWETLFHEASHQFSQDVSKTLQPTWVEEGVACFMEGTLLLPNGAVIPNQVAESRLESLISMIGEHPGGGGGTVSRGSFEEDDKQRMEWARECLTYFLPGSYPGFFYPWGWGFIYYVRNYEDENSERVYLEHFDDFIAEYKGEAQHDVWERWQEYFIERPAIEGVTDFKSFYLHWRDWIRDLNEIHFGGAEQAERLIEMAEKQVGNGKHAYAVETYARALQKDPGHPRAMLGMAEACLEADREDTAMYYFRELLAWTATQPDRSAKVEGTGKTVEELRETCIDEMRVVNRNMADDMVAATAEYQTAIVDLAKLYVEEDFPLTAAFFVKQAIRFAGPNEDLVKIQDELRAKGVDPRIERDLVVDDELSRWESFDARLWKKGQGNTLVSRPSRAAAIISYLDAPDSLDYRFEAKLSLTGASNFPVFGMFYGERVGRSRQIGYIPFEGLCEFRLKGEEPQISEEIESVFLTPGDELAIAIEVTGNQVEYFVNGESVLTKLYPDTALKGRVGFFAWNTEVTVSDMKLTY